MSYKLILIILLAARLIALTTVIAATLYVVRDLLAALVMFWTLPVALGITVAALLLLGESVERCLRLLVACAGSVRLHQPAPSVVGPVTDKPTLSTVAMPVAPFRSSGLLRGKFITKKLLGPTTLLILASSSTMAQEMPRGEVGVGYTFRSYGLPTIQQPPSRLSTNGWNIAVDYNLKSWLGVALDLDSTENASNGADTSIATGMVGPQAYPFGHHKLTPFAHALFGAGRFYFRSPCECFGASGNSEHFSQYDFAWAVGGGVDYTVRPNVGIRLGQFDFEQVSFGLEDFGRGPMPAQNGWKYSAAILLRF
jgi:opacity protein-like surface antigen